MTKIEIPKLTIDDNLEKVRKKYQQWHERCDWEVKPTLLCWWAMGICGDSRNFLDCLEKNMFELIDRHPAEFER